MTDGWPLCDFDSASMDFLGRTVSVHPAVVGPLTLVKVRLEGTEYAQYATEAHRAGRILTGGYNCRPRSSFRLPDGTYPPITPANHSEHAHGCAIDFNYTENPLRVDGFLHNNYAKFGPDDGAAVMRAWLMPPQGLPAFWRWGGLNTTSWRAAAPKLPSPPSFTRFVGGDFADAHHFDLIRLTPEQVMTYDWDAAIARAQRGQEVAELDLEIREGGEMDEEIKKQIAEAAESGTKALEMVRGLCKGILTPEAEEPADDDVRFGFRAGRKLARQGTQPEPPG